ncbi:MAG: YbhB/YbcL family Raf kinase inhibitor-like protein [Candidatus Pacearchaeota archaeon]
MIIKSVFNNGDFIPRKYTCDGIDVNPEIKIINSPEKARSFVLIVDDPDAPRGDWVHWVLYNIPSSVEIIEENSIPKGALQGMNDFGKVRYNGPCPPSGKHRYFFKLYAIDTTLSFNKIPSKSDILNAIKGHIIEKAELVGVYSRSFYN